MNLIGQIEVIARFFWEGGLVEICYLGSYWPIEKPVEI